MVRSLKKIVFADSVMPWSMIRTGGSREETVPILFAFYLIETDTRKILVDTGCEYMNTFPLYNYIPPVKALGIPAGEITDVILTHSHHDHAACTGCYPQATVHIHELELPKAEKYLQNNPHIHSFGEDFFLEEDIRVVWVGGHSPGSCVVQILREGETRVLCGDECYHPYNLQMKEPTASSCCPERSRAFIETYTKPPYVCLLCHEVIV